MTRFGKALKTARIAKQITLREFCRSNNLDCANMSKYERGILAPPANPEKIVGWLFMLGYAKTSATAFIILRAAMHDLMEIIGNRFEKHIRLTRHLIE